MTTEELVIDRLVPRWDARDEHHAIVDAPPAAAWEAVRDLDLMEVMRAGPVKAAMAARGLPDAIVRKIRHEPAPPTPERLSLTGADGTEVPGWHVLGEHTGHELVVGAIGRFWGPKVEWLDIPAEEFATFDRPGFAKIAWSFSVRPYGSSGSLVTNECRTVATDDRSRRHFLRYWRLVGRGASYVMGRSLPVVKRHAEETILAP